MDFHIGGQDCGIEHVKVGYFYPGPSPTFTPLFTQSNNVGNTVVLNAGNPFALYLNDGSIWLYSNQATLGVAAFRTTAGSPTFYFGFEDRPDGDLDYNDVVISGRYVPEPGTYALIGAGLVAIGFLRRRLA